jgi:hypothetical protein
MVLSLGPMITGFFRQIPHITRKLIGIFCKITSRALRSDPFEQLACQIVQLGLAIRL